MHEDACKGSKVGSLFTDNSLLLQVEYQKVSDLYKVAMQQADAHAVDFLLNTIRAVVSHPHLISDFDSKFGAINEASKMLDLTLHANLYWF